MRKVALVVSCVIVAFGYFFYPMSFLRAQSTNRLVKASGEAVYFLHTDGKRYVFPNERVYRSWFADFEHVEVISDATLAALAIGGNVTYRPTSRMLKIETDPKVYAVEKGGVLRWVTSEEVAYSLYGSAWAAFVEDVSDGLFTNYQIGAPIHSVNDYSKEAESLPLEMVGEDLSHRAALHLAPQVFSPPVPAQVVPDEITIHAIHDELLPHQVVTTTDWHIELSPAIAAQESLVTIKVRSERSSGKTISQLTLALAQLTTRNGIGKTENLIFFNDGTHGDSFANDEYFTATTLANGWYRDVGFGSIVANYDDGTRAETRLVGLAFTVFDHPSSQMRAVQTSSYTGFAPVHALQAAQAYAKVQALCSTGLRSRTGFFSLHLGQAYYLFRSGAAYLETGGFVNTVYATEAFYAGVNPSNSEWNVCDAITAHELMHTLYYRVPKPVWVDEGLAEYTSQMMSGRKFVCEDRGWKRDASSPMRPYVSIRPDDWVYDEDHYATGVCAFQAIEQLYGSMAVVDIYKNMYNRRYFEVGEGGGHCAPGFNFYRDVLEASVGASVRQFLRSRFGLDLGLMECVDG